MSRRLHLLLWATQLLLAVLYLFTGVIKLALPVAQMAQQTGYPSWFLRFVGAAEVAGALGLVLPGWLRIKTQLTPIAAACLVVIMIGAVRLTLETSSAKVAILPAVAGILAAFVAYARWRQAPLPQRG